MKIAVRVVATTVTITVLVIIRLLKAIYRAIRIILMKTESRNDLNENKVK